MYFPLLRSKQFELFALRELLSSGVVSPENFCPVIEPVRKKLRPLISTIKSLNESGFVPLVIVNPTVGDVVGGMSELMPELSGNDLKFLPCVALRDSSDEAARRVIDALSGDFAIFVTGGVDREIVGVSGAAKYTIVDESTPPPAIRSLENVVLIGDFFSKAIAKL
ncbi:sce7725 family protein [Microbulbifer elongatus]|uniref:sce7725 family protein n=1 Tax=Microbulbifer elongatus TaxID=86173 RepID=UPI001E37E15E|nr:sce7725 family protein [Microbulbifer elongatus]